MNYVAVLQKQKKIKWSCYVDLQKRGTAIGCGVESSLFPLMVSIKLMRATSVAMAHIINCHTKSLISVHLQRKAVEREMWKMHLTQRDVLVDLTSITVRCLSLRVGWWPVNTTRAYFIHTGKMGWQNPTILRAAAIKKILLRLHKAIPSSSKMKGKAINKVTSYSRVSGLCWQMSPEGSQLVLRLR